MLRSGFITLGCAAAMLLAAPLPAQAGPQPTTIPDRPETERLDPSQQRELEHLLANLRDPRLDLPRRRTAAAILLDRNWPAAERELRRLLLHSDDPTTVRAIAQAIAGSAAPSPRLIEPLVELLGSDDSSLRGDVAGALGRFSDPALVRRLVQDATRPEGPLTRRLGAIRALAGQRTIESAAALVELIEHPGAEPAVREATFEALSALTGLAELGPDVQAWRRWWKKVRDLPPQAWTRELMRTISTRNSELEKRVTGLASRLTDLHTRLYDATGEDGRPAVLQRMLADELPEVRLKALWLIEQRLLNNQQVGDTTRAAMREVMIDRSPAVRAEAARMLEIVADEKAAEQAADLLTGETEPKVLSAYLRLLSRMPQGPAIAPALVLLDDSELRSRAAALLVAAHEKGLLSETQAQQALEAARRCVSGQSGSIDATMLRLLGRLGQPSDQALVVPLLREGQPTIRTAAVESFENDGWTLAPLLDYLDDPSLRPAVWKLIARRGRSAATLARLLESPPQEPDRRAEWIRVIAAVAPRLSLEDLVLISTMLSAKPDHREVHEALLLAAAGLAPDGTPSPGNGDPSFERARLEAEMLLGEFYLRHGEPGKAKPVFSRVAERTTLTVDQRRRVELGRLRRMLQQQSIEEAATQTRQLLSALQSPPTDQIARPWLEAADAALSSDKPADAAAIASRITELFGEKLDAQSQTRLAELKKRLPPPTPARASEPTGS